MGVVGRILRWHPGSHTLLPCMHLITRTVNLMNCTSMIRLCHKTQLTLRKGDDPGGSDLITWALFKVESFLWLLEGAVSATCSSWPGEKQISMLWTGNGMVQHLQSWNQSLVDISRTIERPQPYKCNKLNSANNQWAGWERSPGLRWDCWQPSQWMPWCQSHETLSREKHCHARLYICPAHLGANKWVLLQSLSTFVVLVTQH